MITWAPKQKGFTIVELLIVIVVIAILAAITIVAYNGIQQRAKNSQRQQDIKIIAKALELYYTDNGRYPNSTCSLGAGCKINGSWNSTADASWSNLEAQLVPRYLSKVPQDPQASTSLPAAVYGGSNYDYVMMSPSYCGISSSGQGYLLTYRLEGPDQVDSHIGDCTGTQFPTYSSSEYRVVKK